MNWSFSLYQITVTSMLMNSLQNVFNNYQFGKVLYLGGEDR